MARNFRDDDRQKPVYTSDGTNIGRVRDVQGDRATVERTDDDESLTEEIKEMLGWGDDDDDEPYEIRQDHVERRDDDGIYLQSRR